MKNIIRTRAYVKWFALAALILLVITAGSCGSQKTRSEEIWLTGSPGKLYGVLDMPDFLKTHHK